MAESSSLTSTGRGPTYQKKVLLLLTPATVVRLAAVFFGLRVEGLRLQSRIQDKPRYPLYCITNQHDQS